MAPRITLPAGPDGLSGRRACAARRCPNGLAKLRYALIRIPINSRADIMFCPATGRGKGTGSEAACFSSRRCLSPRFAGRTGTTPGTGTAEQHGGASPLRRCRPKARELTGPRITPWGRAGTPRTRRAFTLVEIVLAAAIIALLAGTFVLALGQWYQKQSVDESALRVEAILRMARAEACSQGRLIRLAFDPSSLCPSILWEPSPLQEPGRFVPHYGAWANDLPTDLLRFIRCRRTGQSAGRLLTYSDAKEPETPDGEPLQSITFMPDGSCDSAVIEVAAADGLDPRTGRIEINGVTGSVSLRMLTPTEQAEQREIDAQAQEAGQ